MLFLSFLHSRFFLRIKHQFLEMTLNKRVDKLVRILLCDVTEYFTAKEALIAAGKIRNRRRDKSDSVQLRAARTDDRKRMAY